jgi:NADH-quinone oxidoreductase subunit J
MNILDIIFWVISIAAILAAISVVTQRDIFRAALFLVVSFLSVAGLFVLLNAEFLAVVQVLVYVGAVSVLIIFAIMLTSNVQDGSTSHAFSPLTFILAFSLTALIVFVAVSTDWNTWDSLGIESSPGVTGEDISNTEQGIKDVFGNTVVVISTLIMTRFVLPMEVVSVVLLAAVIGALALVRDTEVES